MPNAFCHAGGVLLACVLGCNVSHSSLYRAVCLYAWKLSTVQPVLSRPGCNSSEQSDREMLYKFAVFF